MWAYIKDNKIEQIYQRPKSLVIGEVLKMTLVIIY
jgi:hypothetical protein